MAVHRKVCNGARNTRNHPLNRISGAITSAHIASPPIQVSPDAYMVYQ